MNTEIQIVNPEFFQDAQLDRACEVLQSGGLVAFPTETVYGLGGNALSSDAAQKIYAAKGRPSDNPLIVHIGREEDLYRVAKQVDGQARALMDAFWPGPLTLIFHKTEEVPESTTGGMQTVAVRMPSHPVALALIRNSGVLIAAPSANTSGRPSPTKASHVQEDLWGRIDLIIDGGRVGIGIESTIVDMTEEIPVILRPGYITKSMLEDVVGEVRIDPALLAEEPGKDMVAKAPGMKYRHYAPKGRLTIVEGALEHVVSYINEILKEHEGRGEMAAVIATEESKSRYGTSCVYSIGSRKTEGSIAAGLYDILRQMDAVGAEYIYAESFQGDRLGAAIMNRMLKAAGYHKINI